MNNEKLQPLKEGLEKRGGTNQRPLTPKPDNPPKPQKPVRQSNAAAE